MGCSSLCPIFDEFSSSLEWIARHKLGIGNIIHILDDFLIIGKSLSVCGSQLTSFLDLCNDLGVPIAQEKTEGPCHILNFANIELDCVSFEARLPQAKIQRCYVPMRPNHYIRITQDVKNDLTPWQSLFQFHNGKSMFPEDAWYSSSHLNCYTGAAQTLGFGIVFGTKWAYGKWPSDWTHKNIAFLELFP